MPDTELPVSVAATPRVLWIELTSRCPFDCIFCSRKLRRGIGEHLPFDIYGQLIRALRYPRTVILNYSGESTVYPELIPAIRLARNAGAQVELVSALATAPERLLDPLAASGLGRLTVSLHAAAAQRYQEIYRHSSFEALRSRLATLSALCRDSPRAPRIDIGFVAMQRNLDQLQPVAEFAASLGIGTILLFPVMRRDEIPIVFDAELTAPATPTTSFRDQLCAAVERARASIPGSTFHICNPMFTESDKALGQVPRPYPWPLPDDARIHTCEQNPFETAHVLANGDVVACEVLDHTPLGNLHEQPMEAIWRGPAYQAFRLRYQNSTVPECRTCVWKRAYRPAPLEPRILATRGSAQLLLGWHEPDGEGIRWSTQTASTVLQPPPGAGVVHLSGILPPPPEGEENILAVKCNGLEIGSVRNPWGENVPFGLDFHVPSAIGPKWHIEFQTSHVFRPSERIASTDQRDLGFALAMIAAKRVQPAAADPVREATLEWARTWIERADRLGRVAGKQAPVPPLPPARGISILIPERENLEELDECLSSATGACRAINEPFEILVVVNGTPASNYTPLRSRHTAVTWIFHSAPLGFSRAVALGLSHARYGWTYLLNNDVAMRPNTLATLLPLRAGDLFAVSSQIFFKDTTRFREETNFAAFLLEDGLATVHDRIPDSSEVVESFYAGGGASLFRTSLLRRFVRSTAAYAPFYWEDVEWGWRARKMGFRVLFCPTSEVHHRQRATISKFYSPSEIETVIERNRLLFQLRNLTAPDLTHRALQEVALLPTPIFHGLLSAGPIWGITRRRFWNHRTPIEEESLLGRQPLS